MSPTLRDGDWLLVDPEAYRGSPPGRGDLVLLPDPREPDRLLVKRVVEASADGQQLMVAGDTPATSTDSRHFGPVASGAVEGRPWFRFRPLRRWGRIG